MIAESRAATFLRFDLMGALRSRWLLSVAAVDALLFLLFVWLGLRESAILGFTGVSRVVLNVVNVTLLAIPIVVLVATSQSIVRARTTGLLELLLSQPTRRRDWFFGLLSSRAIVLLAPLFLMLALALVFGAVSEGNGAALGLEVVRAFIIVASLTCAFLGLGLWISAAAPSEEKAILWSLFAWLFASALHDFALIGLLLRTSLPPQTVFFLAALNPVEAARVALLANVDAQLSILGPVGFWIANKLGAGLAFAIGAVWPVLLGGFFTWRALRRLERRDLV
ncbi:MAG: ABC transporter permease subunit [Deltaproteobacteria bacterium]|nr:ABC transporter permease subunit [Deltaproteobacteria bacterium]